MTKLSNVCDMCIYFDWWNAECMLDDECSKFTTFANGKEVFKDVAAPRLTIPLHSSFSLFVFVSPSLIGGVFW